MRVFLLSYGPQILPRFAGISSAEPRKVGRPSTRFTALSDYTPRGLQKHLHTDDSHMYGSSPDLSTELRTQIQLLPCHLHLDV